MREFVGLRARAEAEPGNTRTAVRAATDGLVSRLSHRRCLDDYSDTDVMNIGAMANYISTYVSIPIEKLYVSLFDSPPSYVPGRTSRRQRVLSRTELRDLGPCGGAYMAFRSYSCRYRRMLRERPGAENDDQ
jgi:hypothetical protein